MEHRIFVATVTVLGGSEFTSEWSTYEDAWEAALGKAQEIVASEALDRNRADWGIKIYICDIPSERSNLDHEWREGLADPSGWGG